MLELALVSEALNRVGALRVIGRKQWMGFSGGASEQSGGGQLVDFPKWELFASHMV
jgi:hypothetical protein